jgi:hypothetical protein
MKRKWSEDETKYMKSHFASVMPLEAEKMLGRKWSAIYQYGNKVLKIRRDESIISYLHKKSNTGKTKKYNINSKYFSAVTRENAYILGLLLTDGCISKRKNRDYYILSLGLKHDDKYILEKINDKMNSNYIIYENKNMSRLVIRNQEICKDLMNLNMTLRKTKTLRCPKIPDNCIGDFLRGVIDGDGTVQVKKPRTTIFTTSNGFSYDLLSLYNKIGIDAKVYNINRNGSKIYHVAVNGIVKNINLFNILYNDSDLFLERKYDRFMKIYNKYSSQTINLS